MVAEPACAPTNGGKIRLPAPKNIEKKVKVITNRWRATSLFITIRPFSHMLVPL
jgi:hypothetical protein